MKKLLSILLSMAMLLSLGVTAFAAEDISAGVIGGADGPTSILISSNPAAILDMPDLENMTEAELDAYFAELEAQYTAELEAQAAAQKAQMIAAAKSLMPYPDGVNVWLNGAYMTFPDAVPVVKDGRTQVPFRAILEALGATVSYDNGKIDAVFADGSVMKLAIGSNVMTYTYDNGDKFTSTHMDVAPYIDHEVDRTYVPVRFIGEALGLTVTWDPELWVAYIVDWDALEAEINGQFTKINEMLALSMQTQDPTKTYRTEESIVLSGVLDGQSKDPFALSLQGGGLTRGQDMSGSYTIGIDMGGYASLLDAQEGELEAMLQAINGQKIDLVVNAEQGILMRSALLNMVLGDALPANAWLKLIDMEQVFALYDGLGLDMNGLMTQAVQGDFTMGRLVRTMCESGELGKSMGYMAPDSAARLYTALYASMLGDERIKVSGSKTYTCTFTFEDMMDAMVEGGLLGAADVEAAKAELKALGLTMNFKMQLTAKDNKVTRSTADMTMAMEGLRMTMKMESTATQAKGNLELKIDGAGAFDLDFTSKVTESEGVPMTPAAGEPVIDLMEQLNAPAILAE